MSDSPRREPVARHGKLAKPHRAKSVLKVIGIVAAVALVSSVSLAAITTWQLANNIDTVEDPGASAIPEIGKIEGGFNVLIVGSDQCSSDCKGYGVRQSKLNDVNILLHVSEDQSNAVAVSFPRDLVVPIPECEAEDGSGTNSAMSAQPINVALSDGGLPCVAKTVSELTGLDIQFAGLITFNGVIEMSNAIGGVPVCVTGAVDDPRTGLKLKEGVTSLKGKQALAFLRTRHGFADGSDLSRIGAQQVYMSSMIRTLQSNDTLGNVSKLYNLAQAATQNMQLTKQFADPARLVSIALALKDIPTKNISLVTYPSTTGGTGVYAGKVQPIQDQAEQMMEYIQNDEKFTPADLGGRNAVTEEPTDEPSETATDEPSEEPTEEPSEEPTEEPSATEEPTEEPSASETPTAAPSLGSGVTADKQYCVNPS
jgi:LCP family protein required for cell wall assembly